MRPLIMAAWSLAALAACAHSELGTDDESSPAEPADTAPTTSTPLPPPSGEGGSSGGGDGSTPKGDGATDAGADTAVPYVGSVYASTTDTLYAYDPPTNALTKIATLACLDMGEPIIDLAVSKTGWIYAVSWNRFFSINPKDGSCTAVTIGGVFPNSLAFVPAGVIDPVSETLVGYVWNPANGNNTEKYVKISLITGAITDVGNLNGPDGGDGGPGQWQVSGDLVVVAKDGNRTYATIRPAPENPADTDRLAEVDPHTGAIVRVIGDTGQVHLWGLGYWAGKAYGFAENGSLYALDVTNGSSTLVASLGGDGGAWYSGGVSTEAPTTP
jgi:hypothetical protein